MKLGERGYSLNLFILGVPHKLTTDDEYQKYNLPGGAAVVPNLWYVLTASSNGLSDCVEQGNEPGPRVLP